MLFDARGGIWNSNKSRFAGNWKAAEVEVLNEYQFLTAKTVVYLVNMSEKDFIRQKNKWLAKIHAWVQENVAGPIIPYSAVFENKFAELPDDAAREKYIKVIKIISMRT